MEVTLINLDRFRAFDKFDHWYLEAILSAAEFSLDLLVISGVKISRWQKNQNMKS